MGAVYSVELEVKLKDEDTAVYALQYIMKNDTRVRWNLDKYKAAGYTIDTFDGLMGILLAAIQGNFETDHDDDKKVYISSFNASYGWGAVMENVFSALKSCLEDGSRLAYAQDNDEVELVVKDRNIEKTCKEYEEENEDEIANNEPVKD